MNRIILSYIYSVASIFVLQLTALAVVTPGRSVAANFAGASVIAVSAALLLAATALVVHHSQIRNWSGIKRGSFCAAIFPVAQLLLWLILREQHETLVTLAGWAVRLPGEVLVTGIPIAVGAFVFGVVAYDNRKESPAV